MDLALAIVVVMLSVGMAWLLVERVRARNLRKDVTARRAVSPVTVSDLAPLVAEPEPAEPEPPPPGVEHVVLPRAELDALQSWERRFWEMHAVVERVLVERDEWKNHWRQQCSEHLEGQALLEHKIVALRQNLLRALGTYNQLVKQHELDAKPVKVPSDLLPLDASPVGQAEKFYARMKERAAKAPAEFDAIARRDAIAAEQLAPRA